jgi:hypothetical protein
MGELGKVCSSSPGGPAGSRLGMGVRDRAPPPPAARRPKSYLRLGVRLGVGIEISGNLSSICVGSAGGPPSMSRAHHDRPGCHGVLVRTY